MRLGNAIAILALVIPAHAYAQSVAGPEGVLQHLYAAHQPWAGKDVLSDGSLPDYFDEDIVRLIRADRECQAPDWGVGNLDFDPVLSGQDYGDAGIGELQFRHLGGTGRATRYEVSFLLFPGVSNVRTRLVYRLAKASVGWRISDIQYERTTLLRVLSRPCK
jgi:hypothetical protein